MGHACTGTDASTTAPARHVAWSRLGTWHHKHLHNSAIHTSRPLPSIRPCPCLHLTATPYSCQLNCTMYPHVHIIVTYVPTHRSHIYRMCPLSGPAIMCIYIYICMGGQVHEPNHSERRSSQTIYGEGTCTNPTICVPCPCPLPYFPPAGPCMLLPCPAPACPCPRPAPALAYMPLPMQEK